MPSKQKTTPKQQAHNINADAPQERLVSLKTTGRVLADGEKANTKSLVIVESPAKASTINKYLGSNFIVLASFGHIRDLPKKNGSIDVNHDFAPHYQLIDKNKKHINAIIAATKGISQVYLATDPDREGEAIAWHIQEVIKQEIKQRPIIKRVSFNEITKGAVIDAINNPRQLDIHLIDAQQARLTLDYLLGFNISPLLWRKIKSGLSAGRVQSPALRLICERELEIERFIPEDYFHIILASHYQEHAFKSKLVSYEDKKIDSSSGIKDVALAKRIHQELSQETVALVVDIAKKQRKKNPPAPFITSSLQIEASRKLGFNTSKTMKVAQSLYEGVNIGSESVGLITYMRTDSVHLSQLAIDEIRGYIASNYHEDYLPKSANRFVSKVKNAQEAHEGIRPTAITREPKALKKYLNNEQYKLYELIWLRTLASQLAPAILDTTAISIKVGMGVFRLNGVVVAFDGFMRVYQEAKDLQTQGSRIEASTPTAENTKAMEGIQGEDGVSNSTTMQSNSDGELDGNKELPSLVLDQKLPIDELIISEHQTEPKPRYSEASLVKVLEELGIGRPSTYASIIATLKKREYVVDDKKRLIPTDTGMVVNQFLTKHLTQYVDLQFTAKLEDTLDDISNGAANKLPVLQSFWQDLTKHIEAVGGISRTEATSEQLDEHCPQCDKLLLLRFGKYGKFIGCSGFPACKYMRKALEVVADSSSTDLHSNVDAKAGLSEQVVATEAHATHNANMSTHHEHPLLNQDEIVEGRSCPEDNGVLVIKTGRYGKFIACSNYPKCKHRESLNKAPEEAIAPCPECKNGQIIAKKNRYGNIFYACNNYPKCKTLFNHKPLNRRCPSCDYALLIHKVTKTKGEETLCPKCDYKETP